MLMFWVLFLTRLTITPESIINIDIIKMAITENTVTHMVMVVTDTGMDTAKNPNPKNQVTHNNIKENKKIMAVK